MNSNRPLLLPRHLFGRCYLQKILDIFDNNMIICYMSCSEATLPRSLTPLFSYYCGLFVSSKNVTTFRIKHMQTLLSNHPGTVSGSILSDTPGWAAQGEYEFFAST